MKLSYFIVILLVMIGLMILQTWFDVKETFQTEKKPISEKEMNDLEKTLKEVQEQIKRDDELLKQGVSSMVYPDDLKKPITTEVKRDEYSKDIGNSTVIDIKNNPKLTPEKIPSEVKTKSEVDMSKYILRTELPDMSKYVLKSSIKPPQTMDMSKYVLKSAIPSCPTIPDPNKFILKTAIPSCMPLPEPEEAKPLKQDDKEEILMKFVKSSDNPMRLDKCSFTTPTKVIYTPTSKPSTCS